MIIPATAMRDAEREAFAAGVSPGDLMEDAAAGIARFILSEIPGPSIAHIFAGKGNNGGDALAVATRLKAAGWATAITLAHAEEELSPLARHHLKACHSTPAIGREPPPGATRLVIDGLLGTGASGGPREPVRSAINRINRLREKEGCRVLAIDIPSGLGTAPEDSIEAVTADWTIALGAVKSALVEDHATRFAGRIVVVPLPALTPFLKSRMEPGVDLAMATRLRHLLPRRNCDFHKGQAGRVAVIAGSPGMTGAAILAGCGALRGGAGLVTLLAPDESLRILRAAAPPELMVRGITDSLASLSEPGRFDAFLFGPGLGQEADDLLDSIAGLSIPGVIDADGLNAIARRRTSGKGGVIDQLAGAIRGPRLLTPHPGEFARLCPELDGLGRRASAEQFCRLNPESALLLKGARTIIARRDDAVCFNSTGQPGMATAGMGDVLGGVCAALLARGLTPGEAGRAGSWLCGRAAEIAMRDSNADESLLASDVLARLGGAFESLRAGWP